MIMYIIIGILILIFLVGIRIVRPTQRGLVETLGEYKKYASPGFNWVIPFIQSMIKVNITERMMDVDPQEVITKDNLNATVDLVVYYQIKGDEESVKRSRYNVDDFEDQIVSLAQTTARNVIGAMVFKEVNNQRNKLNKQLAEVLDKESDKWGVRVVRVEMKEIRPPKDVQDTMNKIIKAENEKDAAIDFATATETAADGERRALIKQAGGEKQAKILRAEGAAKAFDLVNKSFKGNAQKLKQLEVTQESFRQNSKIVLGDNAKGILKLLNIDK